jgi:hypothetical protein
LKNGFSLRAAIVSWRTRREDVDALVARVRELGDALAREQANVVAAS